MYIYIYIYLGLRKPVILLLFPEFPLISASSDNYRLRAIIGFSQLLAILSHFIPLYPSLSYSGSLASFGFHTCSPVPPSAPFVHMINIADCCSRSLPLAASGLLLTSAGTGCTPAMEIGSEKKDWLGKWWAVWPWVLMNTTKFDK